MPLNWSANDKSQLGRQAQFGRQRFVSEQTTDRMPLFKKRSRFGSFLNGASSSTSKHEGSWTLPSWDTRRIMILVSCIVLFMSFVSSDFAFELSPTLPLPFTFRFFTTRFNVFVSSHLSTTLTWGPYHIEYFFGVYPVPPPILDCGQEYGSLSAGSKIIEELTSATYSPPNSWKNVFIQGAKVMRSPDLALMDGMEAGQCWSFHGASGQLGIQLAQPIQVLALTVGHGNTSSATSAPKDLALWGLKPIDSEFCTALGDVRAPKPNFGSGYCGTRLLSGVYKPSQSTLYQNFNSTDTTQYFDRIVVEILGNWGHPKATCIYRIQIYGNASN